MQGDRFRRVGDFRLTRPKPLRDAAGDYASLRNLGGLRAVAAEGWLIIGSMMNT